MLGRNNVRIKVKNEENEWEIRGKDDTTQRTDPKENEYMVLLTLPFRADCLFLPGKSDFVLYDR